jgi:Kef-type K+ transport system membrane component KefB
MSVHETERLLFFVLAQLTIIIIAARVAGNLARRLGQSRAVGEIIGGLVLGPSVLGYFSPEVFAYLFQSVPASPVTIISQVGLILLMFQIGMDFDFSHLNERRNRRAVTLISASSILFPFVLGVAAGVFSAPHLAPGIRPAAYSLFLGTAFAITAVPILGRIMAEFGLTRTRVGAITILLRRYQ